MEKEESKNVVSVIVLTMLLVTVVIISWTDFCGDTYRTYVELVAEKTQCEGISPDLWLFNALWTKERTIRLFFNFVATLILSWAVFSSYRLLSAHYRIMWGRGWRWRRVHRHEERQTNSQI